MKAINLSKVLLSLVVVASGSLMLMSTTETTPKTQALGSLLDYELPWLSGKTAVVTRSYTSGSLGAHGTGQIDFDLSDSIIVAPKDGTIIYANDSHSKNAYGHAHYNNSIIIKHSDGEYSGYYHLAYNSISPTIKQACSTSYNGQNCSYQVKAGETLALEGNTGYSDGAHLHAEFGSWWKTISGLDFKDEDRDGNTLETIYSAIIQNQHNVGFVVNGTSYTPAQVGSWGGTTRTSFHSQQYFNRDMIMSGIYLYPGNLFVKGGATLTLPANSELNIDFENKKLVIDANSRVLINPSAKLL